MECSACEAVLGLSLSSVNYHKTIETLKKRFESKQKIQDKHMDALLHMEDMSSSHNVKALHRLFDSLRSHAHSLEFLGAEPQSYGSLLCSVFISKLPEELKLVISWAIAWSWKNQGALLALYWIKGVEKE